MAGVYLEGTLDGLFASRIPNRQPGDIYPSVFLESRLPRQAVGVKTEHSRTRPDALIYFVLDIVLCRLIDISGD